MKYEKAGQCGSTPLQTREQTWPLIEVSWPRYFFLSFVLRRLIVQMKKLFLSEKHIFRKHYPTYFFMFFEKTLFITHIIDDLLARSSHCAARIEAWECFLKMFPRSAIRFHAGVSAWRVLRKIYLFSSLVELYIPHNLNSRSEPQFHFHIYTRLEL